MRRNNLNPSGEALPIGAWPPHFLSFIYGDVMILKNTASSEDDNTSSLQNIRATLVPENQRIRFLPFLFGKEMLRGEALTYACLERFSKEYQGGLWDFYTLSNGGCYLAPSHPDKLTLYVASNGFMGNLSADAAGIVATLFTLNHLAQDGNGRFIDLYYLLLDYAMYFHPEKALISSAID